MPDEVVETKAEGSEESQISQTAAKIKEMRERVGKGEQVFDTLPEGEEPFKEGEAAAAVDPAVQWGKEGEGEQEASDAETQQVEGEEAGAEKGTEAAQEGEDEGSPAVDEEGEADEGGEAAEADEVFIAHLPGRGPDDPDVEIEVADAELAERLRQMRKGYERRERLQGREQTVRQAEAEISNLELLAQENPTGFILGHVAKEHHVAIARQLLAQPEVWTAVKEEVTGWDLDPTTREKFASEMKAERSQQELDATKVVEARKLITSSAALAGDLIVEIADGNGLEDDRGGRFFKMAMTSVGDYMEAQGLYQINEDQVVKILETQGILDAWQLDPKKRTRVATEAQVNGDRPSGKEAPAPSQAEVEKARQTGAQMKRAVERKRAVAATAPAGVGAAPVQATFPEGQGVKDRIKAARKKGLATLFGNT